MFGYAKHITDIGRKALQQGYRTRSLTVSSNVPPILLHSTRFISSAMVPTPLPTPITNTTATASEKSTLPDQDTPLNKVFPEGSYPITVARTNDLPFFKRISKRISDKITERFRDKETQLRFYSATGLFGIGYFGLWKATEAVIQAFQDMESSPETIMNVLFGAGIVHGLAWVGGAKLITHLVGIEGKPSVR